MNYRSSSDLLFILLISVLVLQYFPFISFPITQCFPFNPLSSVCAPSLAFSCYDATKLSFPKSLEKIVSCFCQLISLQHAGWLFSTLTDYTLFVS